MEHFDIFPSSYLKHKVFCTLLTSIESHWSRKEFVSSEIFLFLRIASLFESEEYEKRALPIVMKLFQLSDRGIRMLLLKSIYQHFELIPKKVLNDPIYNSLVIFFI